MKYLNTEGYEIINLDYYEKIDYRIDKQIPINLLLVGGVGTGKTVFMNQIYNAFKKKDEEIYLNSYDEKMQEYLHTGIGRPTRQKIIWVNTVEIWEEYWRLFIGGSYEKQKELESVKRKFDADVLMIDDLGAEIDIHERAKKFISEMLYKAHKSKIEGGRPYSLLINTNLNAKQISDNYGDRIYDRIAETMKILRFKNPSYREKKIETMDIGG